MNAIVIGILLIILGIGFYIWFSLREPTNQFSAWAKWFKENPVPGGTEIGSGCVYARSAGAKSATCVPITQFANYLYGNNLEYWLANLFNQAIDTFEHQWQVLYLTSIMRAYATLMPGGQLTPANLCCTIVPRVMFDGARLNSFLNTCARPLISLPTDTQPAKSVCSWDGAIGVKTYMGNSAWEGKKLPGYYPGEIVGGKILDNWDNSAPNWRTFMASVWDLTCTGECPNGSDASKQIPAPVSFKCDENSTQEGVPVGYAAWNHPSNFLFHIYGIPATSQLLVAFMTNKANYGSLNLQPSMINPLLGINIGQTGGGWVGFIRQFNNPEYTSAVNTILYADVSKVPAALANAQANKPKSCQSTAKAGVSGALGGAGMGAMIGAPFPPAGPFIGALIGGIAGGFGSAGAQAASQGSDIWGGGCPKKNEAQLAGDAPFKPGYGAICSPNCLSASENYQISVSKNVTNSELIGV